MKERKQIKIIVFDVDGTLTDGKIHISDNGEAFKSFNIKDGLGIHDILPIYNILPVIITGRNSRILEIRCREMGINYIYQGVQNKREKLIEILNDLELRFENCAYMGDDINDLDCMLECAVKGCPLDASLKIREISDFISKKRGGEGAAREFIEWICEER